ncbi:phosphatidate cytidylyltransferase [Quadrisphaera granulorum]|uniref:Phosphatidate cytidylyltransferase n=1 Tax=Quadrisphaera granulorum TaxID=317664 RepID=A0A316AHJ8_9ACTN|nr:phosphatidate cytidylyltransferase [Quadrisphaera granulorum]PWJ56414.1 phosphatidate cytidylyltransferase [Quadrisphaera granulorum]SZE95048.1 phosphatidate cytidylyltransferase [Quadrisphaera granulorum]
MAEPAVQPARPVGRAGRNLPQAIIAGVVLGGGVLAALLLVKQVFIGVAALAVGLSVRELARALASRHRRVTQVPLVVGSAATLVAAYVGGLDALLVGVCLTAVAAVLWRVLEVPDLPPHVGEGTAAPGVALVRDITAAVLIVGWLPLLAGFAMLMLAADDGAQRVVVFVLLTVCSDVGGYAAGVLFGRHPMAPSISPKKSWEGLAGSGIACVVAGALSVWLLLGGSWWAGALVGVGAAASATLGDLSESILKRDLGIKDMGTLVPGHGGVLDRLDSLLAVAPTTWLLLELLVR